MVMGRKIHWHRGKGGFILLIDLAGKFHRGGTGISKAGGWGKFELLVGNLDGDGTEDRLKAWEGRIYLVN
jgi:hypothetical protein